MDKKANKISLPLVLGLVVLILVLAAVIVFLLVKAPAGTPTENSTGDPVTETGTQPANAALVDEVVSIDLGEGLRITAMGNYAGQFMEDGTNETVSDVMMLVLTNNSENDLQYGQITLTFPTGERVFTVSTLPAGGSALLLEQNRQEMPAEELTTASAENTVFFEAPMALHEETFQIIGMDGALNVKNISAKDIAGDIYVYYKYTAGDMYYGGITFRAKVEGGLKAGELRQIMTGHYSPDNCQILMVGYTE